MTTLSVSIRTASQLTEISETTIREAVNKQILPAHRVGRSIRILTADLEQWLKSLTLVGSDDDR